MINWNTLFVGILTLSASFAVMRINSLYRQIVNELQDDLEKLKLDFEGKIITLENEIKHNKHALHSLSIKKPKRVYNRKKKVE